MADEALTKKYLSLLKKKKSETIRKKYLWSTIEDQLAICEACKHYANDDSRNLVIMLLESLDEEVVFAAVDALGEDWNRPHQGKTSDYVQHNNQR